MENQIGSTSLTTDASGQVVSELRYTAWGEVRYASGDTPTKYQFTGQYSYVGEFGLHFYNARWYDGSLGRFAQADTIIPPAQGVQGWDRYAYVNNNPLRYTDPTGHLICLDDEICFSGGGGASVTSGGNGGGGSNTPSTTPTPDPTPAPTSTPCSIVALACQPTVTSTPFPTTTPTPYTGPAYRTPPPPQPYLDFDFYINWSNVDYIDAGIDVVGLSADIVSLVPAFAPAAPVAQTIGTVTEGIGLIKSGIELIQGNPKSLLVTQMPQK